MNAPVRPEDVEAIVVTFESSGCAELHIRFDGFELHLSADARQPAMSGQTAPAEPAAAPSDAPVKVDPDETALAGLEIVRAPYLGVFYRAPKPGAAPFVEIGTIVEPNSDLCLVEVMKLFTAVRAGIAGAVTHILATDGQMVDGGQPLFAISARP